MKSVNVAELRAHFGEYLAAVEGGEEVQICKRNRGVARILKEPHFTARNQTRLGFAKGSVRILGDIVGPAMDADDWEMHG